VPLPLTTLPALPMRGTLLYRRYCLDCAGVSSPSLRFLVLRYGWTALDTAMNWRSHAFPAAYTCAFLTTLPVLPAHAFYHSLG